MKWQLGWVVLAVGLALTLTGCGNFFLGDDPRDDPEAIFEDFWASYDRHYAHFEIKNIDWDAAYDEFRPQVTSETTDEELFSILGQMLMLLQDGHVYLAGDEMRAYSHAEMRTDRSDFSWSQVEDSYLEGDVQVVGKGNIHYGKVASDLGYIRLSTLSGGTGKGDEMGDWIQDFDIALKALRSTSGGILDLRSNGGGRAKNTKFVASRFATEKRPFLITRTRNGPAHDDFSAPTWWYVEPAEKLRYEQPVVVLTNRQTFSAAEWLTLALRQFDHVRHLGTHSGGGLAMFLPRQLPNGWMYTVSVQDTRCPQGRSYERVGVAPHRYVENDSRHDDAILEAAIKDLRQRAVDQ